MSLALQYRDLPKCKSGPGGIDCPCCSPMHVHPRKSKPLMRRIARRTYKQFLNNTAKLYPDL
jgi:hypothetical protein